MGAVKSQHFGLVRKASGSISFRLLIGPRETLTEVDYLKKVALAWLVVNYNENKQVS